MINIRLAQERGHANFGWLDTRHTFSFGHYFDPDQQGFSSLRVINEDRVQPGQGFDTHPHRDMEIVTYVLEGALEHKDSMGTGSVIRPGDVQMMSAGKGVTHSEFNHSSQEPVHFLQIWIVPDQKGGTPRYQQIHISEQEKRGQFRLLLSPNGENGSLSVHQDIRVYATLCDPKETVILSLSPKRFAYIHLATGDALINGHHFFAGDGARLYNETAIQISKGHNAEVLVFDLPPNELPY
jgi:redox-sensitive bicupin YhaK (pirin superfamily)